MFNPLKTQRVINQAARYAGEGEMSPWAALAMTRAAGLTQFLAGEGVGAGIGLAGDALGIGADAAGGAADAAGASAGDATNGVADAAATSGSPNRIYSARELIRRAEEPGPNHNFPESFNEEIFNGTRTVKSPNYTEYTQRGAMNGKEGTYEIGVRPSVSGRTEVITHRFFRPDRTVK